MIFDTLENAEIYACCHVGFALGFDFIRRAEKEQLPAGRYELDGDRVYAMVQEYETHENNGRFEAHRNYIDIQYIASGREIMEYADLKKCTETVPYTEDIAFYTAKEQVRMKFDPDTFAIFFPNDAHDPGIAYGIPSWVRKIVIKVRV